MKSRGEPVRANDVIAYVITGDGQEYNKNVAERAYSPQDVSKAGSDLTIGIGKQELELIVDYSYYLAKQILPPIERLCAPIDCTDSARIAECLGFDPRQFRSVGPINAIETTIEPLESQISDEERFRDVDPLLLCCVSCSEEHPFTGITSSKVTGLCNWTNFRLASVLVVLCVRTRLVIQLSRS
jgi:DNA polymerase alpha subunit A